MENDLTFSGVSPVVINYNGSTDDIYAPVRTSSCDVNIVSDKILDDLYTASKDELYMTIKAKRHYVTYEAEFDDNGSFESTFPEEDDPDYYGELDTPNFFFVDSNGDTRYNGKGYSYNENHEVVWWAKNLLFDWTTKTWVEQNYWKLGTDQYNIYQRYEYFSDSNNSYQVDWRNDESHSYPWIYEWLPNSNSWDVHYEPYTATDGSQMTYHCNNIAKLDSGALELLVGTDAYRWDENVKKWDKINYTDATQKEYVGVYSDKYMRVKNREGYFVDTYVCQYSSTYTAIVYIYPERNLFTELIPFNASSFDDQTADRHNLFADKGVVYYIDYTGCLYFWSWTTNSWVKWITFPVVSEREYKLDYILKAKYEGDYDIYAIKYNVPSERNPNRARVMYLQNLEPPVVRNKKVIHPEYVESIIWEGYKMPNTYSQPVTLNLDNISMTMIDPVSILKYMTVDKLFERKNIYNFRELIGKSIGYIYITNNTVKIERNVSYGGDYDPFSQNGLLDMKIQMSNFWDEGGEPSTVYDMLAELLKPFCMTLAFDGVNYYIYNTNRTDGASTFDQYNVDRNGTLYNRLTVVETINLFDSSFGWKSQNVQRANIDINSTYDEVTSVASTKKPEYSNMVDDLIDYNQRDQYSYIDLNVQRNKTKGYRHTGIAPSYLDTSDAWYYLWNGAYVNEDYGLESHGGYVNGYLNINKAYEYLTGQGGHPTDYGSILNFYGGGDNPTATGKVPATEKSVEIKKRITAYAADNGVPPEFLELSDLAWSFNSHYERPTGDEGVYDPDITMTDFPDSKYGIGYNMQQSDKVVYHQEYNMYLNENNDYTIDIDLTQSYSRTGIDSNINVYHNNTATNKVFILDYDPEEQIYRPTIDTFKTDNFPEMWNSSNVAVNLTYFNRYATSGGLQPIRVSPVWDKRAVIIYIVKSDDSILWFNGKEWKDNYGTPNYASFKLVKLMNGNKLYHTDYQYDLIETHNFNPVSDETYSLTNEDFVYYTDRNGGVTDGGSGTQHTYTFPRYKLEGNEWDQWINECGEGKLSINLPHISDPNAKIVVDIYNSTMLGMTGSNNNYPSPYDVAEPLYFEYTGTGKYWDEDAQDWAYIELSPANIGDMYGNIGVVTAKIRHQPKNVSYVKAEHLDLSISITVPESNLGQMFNESDIRYKMIKGRRMIEKFDNLTFNVNTYNQLVNNSFSYVIYDNDYANPDEFIINHINVRPEVYTTQAYMNWLSIIRKIYSKTLKPESTDFNNIRTFITSPEVGTNRLMVVSDSVDLKTNRHSISAVECHDLDVDTIEQVNSVEIPRKARNDRYNLPSAYKNK